MAVVIRSYTSVKSNARQRVSEVLNLYAWQKRGVRQQVQTLVNRIRAAEARLFEVTGQRLEQKKILEIGPGQRLRQCAYLSCKNDVIGIDLDAIAQGFDPVAYWRMLRQNGPRRVAKTLGRKALGLDRKFFAELAAELSVPAIPRPRVLAMDATHMAFPDASFDTVVSFAVFEHLPDPGRVIDEASRVLRPGGCAYLSLHLYTCDNGCHDPRIFSGRRADLPQWPHLRPESSGLVRPNAYLNKLRLADWRQLFTDRMPGVQFDLLKYGADRRIPLIRELRAKNALTEYTDDELLTVDFAAIWKKPE